MEYGLYKKWAICNICTPVFGFLANFGFAFIFLKRAIKNKSKTDWIYFAFSLPVVILLLIGIPIIISGSISSNQESSVATLMIVGEVTLFFTMLYGFIQGILGLTYYKTKFNFIVEEKPAKEKHAKDKKSKKKPVNLQDLNAHLQRYDELTLAEIMQQALREFNSK